MRFLASALLLTLMAVQAEAQWYARGEFNGFGTDIPMVVDPGDSTHYTANIVGFGSFPYNWKIAEEDWSPELPGIGPGNDARFYTNPAGEGRLHLYDQTTWSDGYFPNNARRVGYDDHDQFDWEIVGSFNGWPGAAFDPAYKLTDMGNGLHVGTFAMPAGPQEFKFRGLVPVELDPTPDDYTVWDNTIGQFFRNSANNNTFNVGTAGDLWTFELDLVKGRFRRVGPSAAGQEGDFNQNGIVDTADYTVWRDNVGSNTPLPNDPNGTPVGNLAYQTWKAHYGQGTLLTWFADHTPQGAQTQLPDTNLNSLGGGKYELNYTGLTAGENYDFQIKKTDLSESYPINNMRVRADAAGEIGLKFYDLQAASWGDGWSPSTVDRVGYKDPEQFGWDIIGSFPESNWGTPLFSLTNQGNGLYTGTYVMTAAGNFAFKFRHQDETNAWNISIGDDFANNAANAEITVGSIGQLWHFELDLPNGRWRAYAGAGAAAFNAVPEPSALVVALVGLMFGVAAKPRRR
jgi:hypothetical protein